MLKRILAVLLVVWIGMVRAEGIAPIVITSAEFGAAGAPPIRVELPDTWASRGAPSQAQGRYRFSFDLEAAPQSTWALFFRRLSTHHRIWLNGQLVADEATGRAGRNPAHAAAVLVDLPPALLVAGRNQVEVELRYTYRGGLSTVSVGPMAQIRSEQKAYQLLAQRLPQALNAGAAAVALLLLMLWWRRRQEVALGAFGALALLVAARNYSYFLDVAVPGAVAGDWLLFASHAWSVYLLAIFAQRTAEASWPRFTRLLLAWTVAVSAAGAWAIATGHGGTARALVYPVHNLLALLPLGLLLRHAVRSRGWSRTLQVAGLIALVGSLTRDLSLLFGAGPITEIYWAPYVLPVTIIVVALALLARVVRALDRVEGLNVELEATVAQRTRRLEAANAAKSRFLAAASHDLRQPLVSVGLMVEMAREQAESPAQRHMLDRAAESVIGLETLLTGLLDLSRLDAMSAPIELQPVSLTEMWSRVAGQEAGAAAAKGLRLRFRPTDRWVMSDAVLLERALRNLVSNAVRYTERGGVLVAARSRNGLVRLEVRDSGVGIAASDRPRIFDEFFQVERNAAQGGLGLGLAIVARSMELLGHRLNVISAPGRGSLFAIDLMPAPASAPQPRSGTTTTPEPSLTGRTIVVVEDDAPARDALSTRLQSWGAAVEAFDGLDALSAWLGTRPARPDALLTDYQLSTGSGTDAILALRAHFPEAVPALILTGATAPDVLERFVRLDVSVLHKPYRSEALAQALRALLAPDPS
jgi:signal transduction histidine kinase/CheY-like chemotaxis protein